MDDLLADGGVIRKVWIGEAEKYREHLLRLDADSRRNRFGGAIADELILAYEETAMQIGTVMHGFLVDGILRGVAELKPFGAVSPGVAEVAFSIEKPWQSHGVGSALLERTLLAARNRGIKLVHMSCLAGNARMQQLARKYEAELSFDFGSVVGEVEAPHATPLSLFREFVADGHGFAAAVLDAQVRLIRPAGEDERMTNGE
jgi:GNAT superfamily N-acetyltransferase